MKKEPRTFQIRTGVCVSNIPLNSRAGVMYLIFNLILLPIMLPFAFVLRDEEQRNNEIQIRNLKKYTHKNGKKW